MRCHRSWGHTFASAGQLVARGDPLPENYLVVNVRRFVYSVNNWTVIDVFQMWEADAQEFLAVATAYYAERNHLAEDSMKR